MCFVFFFQAEDGIRDIGVTGVQTCALPILVAGYDALIAAPIATIYACVVAMLTEKTKFQSVIDAAIASVREIQVALFILMIAYAMAEAFMSTGVGASIIIIALKFGITGKTVALVGAIVTAILSIATGTSWGTFAACEIGRAS